MTKSGMRNSATRSASLVYRTGSAGCVGNEILSGHRGAAPTYTDAAIETLAVMQYLFRQASRQAEGLLSSILALMQVKLPVPDHTTLSRRRARLAVRLPVQNSGRARHIVADSTGVKVSGEG